MLGVVTKSKRPPTPAPDLTPAKDRASAAAALPRDMLKTLAVRLGLPLLGGWLVAAFVHHWAGYALMGALTLAAAGLVFWAFQRIQKSKRVADILQNLEPTDKAGRKAALEKLDQNFKKGDLAATFAKAQLLMQDDPDKALAELEALDLEKMLPAEADQVRFQRALIHLTRGEADRARRLVDPIDLTRHEDGKGRALMGAVVAEAWARTGQARRGMEILDRWNPDDPALAEISVQLWRARAFTAAALNDMKQVRRALRKLASANPQYLSLFLVKKVHPLLAQEAKQLYLQSGAAPPRRMQYQRR